VIPPLEINHDRDYYFCNGASEGNLEQNRDGVFIHLGNNYVSFQRGTRINTNNYVEAMGLCAILSISLDLEVSLLVVFLNSRVVCN
jgi:ribonuclease HI